MRAGRRTLARGLSGLALAIALAAAAGPALAQTSELLGLPVTEVRVEQEGRPVSDRLILGLIETEVGEPLSMRDVRRSIDHLYGLGRFDDIQVAPERSAAGVIVTFVLVPRHAVQAVEFRGSLGLREGDLRQSMTERFGALPAVARADDVARELRALYRVRGYPRATVEPGLEEFHDPDRAVLIFTINSGPRATIERVEVAGLDAGERAALVAETGLRPGQEYDAEAVQRRLERYERDLRGRGYYEARATHSADFDPGGRAVVDIAVDRGPRVSLAFAGDPLPAEARSELVPVRREASADEDLLEDSARAIEDYLHARGYRDARAEHTRETRGEELVITFTVRRGPRHVVDGVQVSGNTAIPEPKLLELLRVESGRPFVQATLDAGVAAIEQAYRAQGFTRAAVKPAVAVLPSRDASPQSDRRVQIALDVAEGPRTVVDAVVLDGNTVLGEGQIRAVMTTAPCRPFSEIEVARDRDRIQLEYLNRGYESATVEPRIALSDGDTRATVRMAISEGPQVLVDHVIIIGNERTSTRTIENALLLKPGEPLGYAARLESQQRLAALGLFRRVNITELRHGSEPRRDVLVEVEEAPPTTVGYGGGIEVDSRLRTGEAGQAEERLEVAPRGFFEISRRNLWGKNRSVTLFTRVSLRSRDRVDDPTVVPDSTYGFNEYRVVANFREPRVLETRADLLVTGILEQAIRSSFNFRRRQARAEMGLRLSPRYGIAGRYSFERTELFDERFTDADEPLLIDRLFPQVRLSKFSVSVLRDTRSDVLDPDSGNLFVADNDFAARAVGSEVGFAKTYLQALSFHRLPSRRRMVVGLAARLGLAHGFRREVLRPGQETPDVIEDLPASERFFAGGDTTVRGFSLDRLGTDRTLTPSGFPTGGNGLVVLNAELRVNAWRALDGVGFLDGGNVFPRVGDIDLGELRGAVGFGIRYRSPVGPIRIDLGFKLDRRELVSGTLERRSVLHVSFGQAF